MTIATDTILSQELPDSVRDGRALPWTLIGAAIAAMAALYFSGGRFIGLPMGAALLIFSRFTQSRLPKSIVITYGVRAFFLVVVVTIINRTDAQDTTVWYLKQDDTTLAGYAVAADIVMRAWERRDKAGAREGLGVVVLMTALLFAAASNTYERVHIQIITPIYAILLVMALRSFAMMQQPASARRTLRRALVVFRVVVIFVTLGFAFTGVYAVTHYEYQVIRWASQFARQRHEEQHEIGLTTSPQLARVFNPEPSTSRVLIIDGQLSEAHLRIAAFEQYQGRQWLPLISDRFFEAMPPADPPASIKVQPLRFTRVGDTADLLPLPLTAAAIHCADPLEEESAGSIRDTKSGSLERFDLLDATSPAFQGPLSRAPMEKDRKRLLAIPAEIDPRVVTLAKSVAGTGAPGRQAFRIQEYLRSQYAYSLSFDPHGEPLNDFILNKRAAHCQYFASALVIMARAVGVPARYVGGYYAHEPYGNDQIVVRQRDAHAWAECWLDGVGWATFDATPTGGKPDAIFADPPAWKRWWEKLTDLPGEIRDWISSHSTDLEKFGGALAVVALCYWVAKQIRNRKPRVAPMASLYSGPDEKIIELARRYESWMSRQGIACPPQQTWRAHLATPHDSESNAKWPDGTQVQLCDQFVQTYDRARFGFGEPETTRQADQILHQIEASDGR